MLTAFWLALLSLLIDDGGAGGDPGKTDPPKSDPTPDDDPPKFKTIESQEDLDRIVQSRLARERSKFADYDDLKTKAEEFDKLQDSQKTELQKASDTATKAVARAEAAELKALRLEVAAGKGLSPSQAKRLVGKTKEELEADADELLDSFKDEGSGSSKAPPGKRPTERLSGGGDPSEEPDETDPEKLTKGLPSIT